MEREETNKPLLLLGMSERPAWRPMERVGLELETYRMGDESVYMLAYIRKLIESSWIYLAGQLHRFLVG